MAWDVLGGQAKRSPGGGRAGLADRHDERGTFQRLADLMQDGASFVVETFDPASEASAGIVDDGWPVALVRTSGDFMLFGPDHEIQPTAGDLLVRLYRPAIAIRIASKQSRWGKIFRGVRRTNQAQESARSQRIHGSQP